MRRDWERVKIHEDRIIAENKPNLLQALKIFEGMYNLAVSLGCFPRKDINEGLEDKCRIAANLKFIKWQKSSLKESAKH